MRVFKNILPAQRHLIFLCQSDSVCFKGWPRAQGFKVRKKERARGCCHFSRSWTFLVLPKGFLSLHAEVMCRLWPVSSFTVLRSAYFPSALTVQKRSCPLTLAFLLFTCVSGTWWLLCPHVCLHWEIQVFPVVLPSLEFELQDLCTPEMSPLLEFGHFSQFDLFLGNFAFWPRRSFLNLL